MPYPLLFLPFLPFLGLLPACEVFLPLGLELLVLLGGEPVLGEGLDFLVDEISFDEEGLEVFSFGFVHGWIIVQMGIGVL